MAGTQFVGRRGELDRLGRVLLGDPDAATVAVVIGDAGIGKTRLVTEAVRSAPDVLVLAGACLPFSESLPYGAVTDALSTLTGPSGRPALDRALGRCAPYVRPQMAALIPALSDDQPSELDGTGDRTRLFAAVRDLVGSLSTDRRTALVLEDLHWADSGTLDLLTFLVRRMPVGSALAVTSRSDELPADHSVVAWLSATTRLPSVELIPLLPLPPEDVGEMVSSLLEDGPDATFVANVVRRGQGSPFFTEQLVAAARDAAPPLELPTEVPAGVAQMLLTRVRSVGHAATEVAAALAVAARPLAEPELAACVGTGVDVALALRELLDAHLVEPAAEERYRLRHALLEDTVSATLLASQRTSLHASVATVLADRVGESPAEVAAHWARAGNRAEEARWSVDAARQAEHVYAWSEAARYWLRVDNLWAHAGPERSDIDPGDALIRAVDALWNAGEEVAAGDLLRDVLASDRFDADREVRARLLLRAGLAADNGSPHVSRRAIEEAVGLFAGFPPSGDQARALQRLAWFQHDLGDHESARATTAAAVQVGDLANASVELRDLATGVAFEDLERGNVAMAQDRLREGLRRARADGHGRAFLELAVALTDVGLRAAEHREVVEEGMDLLREAEALGLGSFGGHSFVLCNVIQALLRLGDVTQAHELIGNDRGDDPLSGWPRQLAIVETDLARGQLAEAIERYVTVGNVSLHESGRSRWLAELGSELALWTGEPARTRSISADAFGLPMPEPERVELAKLLSLAARALVDESILGSRSTGSSVDLESEEEKLRHVAGETGAFAEHPGRRMAAGYALAFHAELLRRRPGEAAPAWEAAAREWQVLSCRHLEGYTCWRQAEALLDLRHRGDAESVLRRAHVLAAEHEPLTAEIQALARRARIDLAAGPADVPSADERADAGRPFSLTDRELSVLALLTQGLTNTEIGRELYMSPKTASVHVSAILRKLGVSGRVQAATVAERMGLLAAETEGGRDP